MRVSFMLVVAVAIASPATGTDLWRCEHPDGTVELRDRPCPAGVTGAPYAGGRAGTFNTIEPADPPEALLERSRRSTRESAGRPRGAGPSVGEARDRRLRCAEHEARVAAIDRRLRKGYSAQEGNRLRAERRRIERLLNDACR